MNKVSIVLQVAIVYLLAAILCALPTWFALGVRMDILMDKMRVAENTALFVEEQLKGYTERSEAVLTRQDQTFQSFKSEAEGERSFVHTEVSFLRSFLDQLDDDLELLEPVRQKRILRELRK